MDLIPYSDSDEESNHSTDNDEIIEITQNPVITQQLNFKPKSTNQNTKTDLNISLDFGTNSTHKSLFDSLPFPSKTSLHQNIPNKKTKKKHKKSKKKKNAKKTNKKRKLQTSLIDILPKPKHKKQKTTPLPKPTPKPIPTETNNSDQIQNDTNSNAIKDTILTNDIRKNQAEMHRKYTNPLATFSITNTAKIDTENSNELNDNKNKNINIPFENRNNNSNNSIGIQFETASSMYKVNNNNNNINLYKSEQNSNIIDRDNEKDKNDRIKYLKQQFNNNKNLKKDKNNENNEDGIINISHTDLINDKKPWMRTFEIDDITRQDIKCVSTNTYNPQTGMVEKVKKYTKTQKRKHQINTLAYEAQEKALQLAMSKSASYKTKAETQAKYGW